MHYDDCRDCPYFNYSGICDYKINAVDMNACVNDEEEGASD